MTSNPLEMLTRMLSSSGPNAPSSMPESAPPSPSMGSLTPPSTGTGGAVPQGMASLFGLTGMQPPVSASPTNAIPTDMPMSGSAPPAPTIPPMPSPAQNPAPAQTGGLSPPPIGKNMFGVHPTMTHHDVLDWLLPRVKNVESGGNYGATNNKSSASGAYQYIDSTWNGYKGYSRAKDAPPEVQEERAAKDFERHLSKYGNDPFKAAAYHYFPQYADHPELWDKPLVNRNGQTIAGAAPVSSYLGKIFPQDKLAAYVANQRLAGQQPNQQLPNG